MTGTLGLRLELILFARVRHKQSIVLKGTLLLGRPGDLEGTAISTSQDVISSEKSQSQLFVATSCLPTLVLYAFVTVVIVLGWY